MTISGAILFGLSRSPIGLILQASGQDAVQAGALGFNVAKHKLAAFVVSAFFSGLAGALMVFYMGTASVGTFVDLSVGVQVIIAAVLGGRRTVIGAAIGAIFLIGMGELLRPLGELATLIVSVFALRRDPVLPRRLPRHAARRGAQPWLTRRRAARRCWRSTERARLQALRRPRRRQGPELLDPAGRDPRPDRPERVRQVDRDEDHHGRRAPTRGLDPPRRRRDRAACPRTDRATRRRPRVPAFAAAASPDGAREHQGRAAARPADAAVRRRRRRREGARDRRARRARARRRPQAADARRSPTCDGSSSRRRSRGIPSWCWSTSRSPG